jgi:uncharacterized protein YggT (Ycf19 family)
VIAEASLGLVDLFLTMLARARIARAFAFWVDPCSRTTASRVLYEVTEPIQAPICRRVPPIDGRLDVSCWISLFLIRLLSLTLHQALLT